MPFRLTYYAIDYGIYRSVQISNTYCVNDINSNDYGNCYNVTYGRPIFVVTDDFLNSNKPSLCSGNRCTLPCESSNTCTRYNYRSWERYLNTAFDGFAVGKQAVLYSYRSLTHHGTAIDSRKFYEYTFMVISVYPDVFDTYIVASSKRVIPFFENGFYDPLNNVAVVSNRYIPSGCTTDNPCTVVDVWWSGQLLTSKIIVGIYEDFRDNVWYAGHIHIRFAYETSPFLIMPIDYNEYLVYPELRKTVAYAANGVDQPGWNADDILRVVRELFPDRPWLVYDDRNFTLYSSVLTIGSF